MEIIMANSDFKIEKGVLIDYLGEDENVIIPDSVTEIGSWAFRWSDVKTVTMGNSVTRICTHAFDACEELTEINISDSVITIERGTFERCGKLRRVTLGESVQGIGYGAFTNCTALEEINIPASVKKISACVFECCPKLKTIRIDEKNRCFKFEDGALYYSAERSGEKRLISYFGEKSRFVIPSGVTEIGEKAFSGIQHLTEVVIPESVTDIGRFAFSGCLNLEKAVFSDSVCEINEGVFYFCSRLSKFTVPENVTRIGARAFFGCSSLSELVVPNTVRRIDVNAFVGVKNITLPRDLVGNVNVYLYKDDVIPECIQMSVSEFELLDKKIQHAAIKGYVRQWEQGTLDEWEQGEVLRIVKEAMPKCFDRIGDDPVLYEYVTANKLLTKRGAEKLLEKTESLECRALVLEYMGTFKRK